MEIQEPRYYNLSKFSNTQYLVLAELKKYFGDNIFRGNRDRVIYSSSEYMFRQRLNLLSKANVSSIEALEIPFMAYYREGNWKRDGRVANINGFSAQWGRPDEIIGGQKLRYIPMIQNFTCVALFGNDVDAQLAYETLMFMQYPTEKMILPQDAIEYKGYNVPVYVGVQVSDVTFNEGYKETTWLKENRVIPVSFRVQARSVIFSQAPQGPESTVFQEDQLPTLTERVYLDFLSYKDQDNQYLKENIVMVVEGIINPDPTLNATIALTDITEESITVGWDFNPDSEEFYEDTVKVFYNNTPPIDVPINQKTYTFENLIEGSFYTVGVIFTSLKGEVYYYTSTATTSGSTTIQLKGMKG